MPKRVVAKTENSLLQVDMAYDFARMKLSELLRFAEEKAAIEREGPCSIDTDSTEGNASWASTLEVLRLMKQKGVQSHSEMSGQLPRHLFIWI